MTASFLQSVVLTLNMWYSTLHVIYTSGTMILHSVFTGQDSTYMIIEITPLSKSLLGDVFYDHEL